MYKASFWLASLVDLNSVILSQSEIEVFNQKVIEKAPEYVYDLSKYPSEVSKDMLCTMLDENSFMQQKKYLNGMLLDNQYYEKLQQEINAESIVDNIIVQYGFTVRHTNMRILPTNDFVTNRIDDCEFDRLQQTAVSVAEPLIILHVSASRQWYFVQSYYALGWISATHVAVAAYREEWLSYSKAKDFLVVTGNRIRLGFNAYFLKISEMEFHMGDKLPLACGPLPDTVDNQSCIGNYVIKLPIRQDDGQLAFKLALVPIVSDVCIGYLEYTRANIIKQAFKMQGDRYGWGGSFNSRDCSSFIMDIYRSFGVKLPRNTWEQMKSAGITVNFSGATIVERINLLKKMKVGTALYFKGHVMLYLGEYDGQYYVIHAIAECGDITKPNVDSTLAGIPLYNIMITDLSLVRTTGHSLLEALTMGKLFE